MPYCTQADILALELTEREMVELTDDSGLNDINTSQVTAAIAQADALIDQALAARYTVPLQSVPGLIKGYSATLAAVALHRNRPLPELLKFKARETMRALGRIKNGDDQIVGLTQLGSGSGLPATTTPDEDTSFDWEAFLS